LQHFNFYQILTIAIYTNVGRWTKWQCAGDGISSETGELTVII